MATIYDIVNQVDGKGYFLAQRGYEYTTMAREMLLLGYKFSDLNKNEVDWKNISMKNVAQKVSTTQDGKKVVWEQEDLRIPTCTISVRTSATSYDLSTTDIVVGESLYNQRTGTTVFVTASSAGTVTLNGAGDTASLATDILVRTNYAKPYGEKGNLVVTRSNTVQAENYVQYSEFGYTFNTQNLNSNRIFLQDPKKFVVAKIGDMARRTIVNMCQSFFIGIAGEITAGGKTYYTAAGIKSLLGASYKNININGASAAGTLKKLEAIIDTAYGSGIDVEGNKMVCFANQKMLSLVTSLVDDKLVYNDVIKGIDMEVTKIRIAGQVLLFAKSVTLETLNNAFPEAYLVPVEDCFMFNLPALSVNEQGAVDMYKTAILHKKPQNTPEAVELALYSSYSFVFPNIGSGAYQHFYYV